MQRKRADRPIDDWPRASVIEMQKPNESKIKYHWDICTISTYAMRQFNLRSTENYLRIFVFRVHSFGSVPFSLVVLCCGTLRENRCNCACEIIISEYWEPLENRSTHQNTSTSLAHHIRSICIFNCNERSNQTEVENFIKPKWPAPTHSGLFGKYKLTER